MPEKPIPEEAHPTFVLAVDDSPEVRLSMAALLAATGRTVVSTSSAEEALERLDEHDYAVALLDVQLPGMDGFELAERIRAREQTRHLPIIFVTGTSMESRHVFHGYELGAVDYLLQPIDPHILKSKVDVFCNLQAQRARIGRYVTEIEAKNAELERHLAEIKTLRGLIPICSSCKKVRKDDGYWEQVEVYIMAHSEAEFTHGICADCIEVLYGDEVRGP